MVKRIAHQVVLQVDETKGGSFSTIGQVQTVATNSTSREVVDMTCLDDVIVYTAPSPVTNVNQLTFTLFWDEIDSEHDKLNALASNVDRDIPWKVILPFGTGAGDTTELAFNGYISELAEPSYEVQTEVTRDVTVELTTAVTKQNVSPP